MYFTTVYSQKTIRASRPEDYDRLMNEAMASYRTECHAWPDRRCCEFYWAMMKNGKSQRKEITCLEQEN